MWIFSCLTIFCVETETLEFLEFAKMNSRLQHLVVVRISRTLR